ncbi:hypothetical protein [Seonamhaeicola sp. ML3]|uniref:hypothetical protein n=1 Tax=Seonamhaeicola sp. ML3 TaxID=2937786 RepID=UPI00200D37DB|nr:hypothetical protein [Seonamhaeicola sp. ML3]
MKHFNYLLLVFCVSFQLLKAQETKQQVPYISDILVLSGITDFKIDTTQEASYYQEKKRGTLAINAANVEFRDKWAGATHTFNGKTGYYSAEIETITENDGESVYQFYVNNKILKSLGNPETSESFMAVTLKIGKVFLKTGDQITITSKAVTNGKIPEKGGTAWSRGRWKSLKLTPVVFDLKDKLSQVNPFEEKEGLLVVEAEDFHFNTNNESPRKFLLHKHGEALPMGNEHDHTETASGKAYLKALPDTRVTHDDKLIVHENFYPTPGIGGMVSYKVKINNPGTYFVWVRAFSTGPEDNGIHVGVNGTWPKSGQRIQLCKGKHKWTWSSAQRVPKNHCGDPQTITLAFDEKGEYIVSFSMREDGFELDKWILSKDKSFIPN